MKRLKIAVCDDDAFALEMVRDAIVAAFSSRGVEVETDVFFSSLRLEKHILGFVYDIVFLDIDMPELDGISLGEDLRKHNVGTEIVYVSGREDRVFETFTTKPFGFIRKGKFREDVAPLIERYLNSKFTAKEALVIKTQGGVQTIPVKSVVYIEGAANSQYVHLDGVKEPIRIHRSLEELEAELGAKDFLRIHKGFLVNSDYIRGIEPKNCILAGGEMLPVSRRKVVALKAAFLKIAQKKGFSTFG